VSNNISQLLIFEKKIEFYFVNWYNLQPIWIVIMDKDSLKKKVVKKIIALIASGQYADSQPLPAERKLAADIGVSRGTLRKALEELAELGLVEIRQGSGAYVRHSSFSDVPEELLPAGVAKVSAGDMMVARKAIELAAIETAVERMSDEQVRHLQMLVSDMAYHCDDLAEFLSLDIAFHRYLVECSGNPVLLAAYDAIEEYHRYLQVISTQNEHCEQLTLTSHLRIAAGIARRDTASAREALDAHLDSVVEQMK
jgi:GntR family transcriptional repressor for pyruvate dehydrogenase complex